MPRDVLAILEAAYAQSATSDAWLQNALEAIHPHLDQGSGVLAHFFAHTPGGLRRDPLRAVGADAEVAPVLDRMLQRHLERMPRAEALAFARKVYPRAPVVAWVNRLLGRPWGEDFVEEILALPPDVRRRLGTQPDSLGVIAGDPSGTGCVFFARGSGARLPRQAEALWRCVASHLVTGYRLTRQRERGPDAVLSPGGKVLHLEREAVNDGAPLSEATRAIDRARGKLRRTDPERALTLWRGLVAGRWSLVDHFDHDGRRYVFAKRNAPEVRPWHSLTERESQIVAFVAQGQTHKIIAYQLGLSPSAVGESLLRARRKLGARSRLDLVSAYLAVQDRQEP